MGNLTLSGTFLVAKCLSASYSVYLADESSPWHRDIIIIDGSGVRSERPRAILPHHEFRELTNHIREYCFGSAFADATMAPRSRTPEPTDLRDRWGP